MPSSSISNHSSKDTFKRGFKANAERIATSYRKELGLNDFDPLSAFLLAQHIELELLTPHQIPGLSAQHLNQLITSPHSDQWSAVTIGYDKPCVIIYNSAHHSSRTQSNIMHEIAHVILRHPMGEIDTTRGIPLREYNQNHEQEAEWLGGCLQLPKTALVKYYIYKKNSLEQIADTFNASLAMVKYRISVSGVQALKNRLKI